MGVASGCGEQEVGVASGSGWNLWVWLLGVVLRRYGMGHKKVPVFIKQRPCNGNFAFRFRARSVLHITVFIFDAWAKLF